MLDSVRTSYVGDYARALATVLQDAAASDRSLNRFSLRQCMILSSLPPEVGEWTDGQIECAACQD